MSREALEERIQALEEQLEEIRKHQRDDMVSVICFSAEWDRLFAAFTIASGALAMGQEVHIFFTFWSVPVLREAGLVTAVQETDVSQTMLVKMLPGALSKARLSRFNFLGLGKVMLRRLMKKRGVEDIDALMREVRELGAHLHLCDTSSGLFGLSCTELTEGEPMDRCGVATFLNYALRSKTVLFI